MQIEKIGQAAVIMSPEPVFTDEQTALDLMMTVWSETGTNLLVIEKSALPEDFFKLSTGLAGAILQKFVNYNFRAAIYGDYSHYTSKPLKDFMYESNSQRLVYFAATKQEAIARLERP